VNIKELEELLPGGLPDNTLVMVRTANHAIHSIKAVELDRDDQGQTTVWLEVGGF
jgi:hypothetical protein